MTIRTTKARAVRRRRGCIIEVPSANGGVAWKLKFDVPTSVRGERRTHYKTVHGTREEAETELARLTGQARDGVNLKAGKQTLAGWVDEWLADYAGMVSTRTLECYDDVLRRNVVRYLGAQRLDKIAALQIERLYTDLAQEAGLARRTILLTHRILSLCLKDAKRLRLISNNPMEDVNPRRLKALRQDTSEATAHVLDLGEMLSFFEVIKANPRKSLPYPLALLAFDSGARRGELLGLRWSDLDLDQRRLHIERAVEETKAGVVIKPRPKTKASRRTITLSAKIVDTLRQWRASQLEDRFKLGGMGLPAEALIFPASIERPTVPIRPRAATKAFACLTRQAGLRFRFHDFRHSCASHLLKSGVPVPEVARHLGHASPQVTMTVYAHAVPDGDDGLGLLDRLMGAAEG